MVLKKKTTHTLGLYTAIYTADMGWIVTDVNTKQIVVAKCHLEANAHFLAVAPELLSALRDIRYAHTLNQARDKATDAITKFEGEWEEK